MLNIKKVLIGLGVLGALSTSSFGSNEYFTKDTVNYFFNMNTSECVKISEETKKLLLEANEINSSALNFKATKQTPDGGLVFLIEVPVQKSDGTYGKSTNAVVSSLKSCQEIAK